MAHPTGVTLIVGGSFHPAQPAHAAGPASMQPSMSPQTAAPHTLINKYTAKALQVQGKGMVVREEEISQVRIILTHS